MIIWVLKVDMGNQTISTSLWNKTGTSSDVQESIGISECVVHLFLKDFLVSIKFFIRKSVPIMYTI